MMRESKVMRAVLVICNVAGMVDLVALPLWVGSLMQTRGLGPQAAGLTVTCYIAGVFASSMLLAPRFSRIAGRKAASVGFGIGAAAFFALSGVYDPTQVGLLHVVAGLGAGCGLSFTHGTIARTANPHRMFAMAGLGVGVFAVLFFGAVPGVIAANGASGLFVVLGCLLAIAAVSALAAFPAAPIAVESLTGALSSRATLAFMGVACFAITQSMIFSFVERIGLSRGFSPGQVGAMLLIGGLVNITAPILASALERRISAFMVSALAVPAHGVVGALVTVLSAYVPWAACSILFVWLILFGHNFMFGLIARLDPSGRTAASTPAMLMIGAGIGPVLGGTLAEVYGYPSLGIAALIVAAAGTGCFLLIWRRSASVPTAITA